MRRGAAASSTGGTRASGRPRDSRLNAARRQVPSACRSLTGPANVSPRARAAGPRRPCPRRALCAAGGRDARAHVRTDRRTAAGARAGNPALRTAGDVALPAQDAPRGARGDSARARSSERALNPSCCAHRDTPASASPSRGTPSRRQSRVCAEPGRAVRGAEKRQPGASPHGH